MTIIRYRLLRGCRIWVDNAVIGEITAVSDRNYQPRRPDGTEVRARNKSRLPGWPDERSAIAALLVDQGVHRLDVTTERIWKVLVHEECLGEVHRFQRGHSFFYAARSVDGTMLTTSRGQPGWTDKDTAARALIGHHYPRAIRSAAA